MRRLTLTLCIGLRGLATLLLNRRARQAVCGLMILRRVYEYVLLMATVETVEPGRRSDHQGYVDALSVLAAKAASIAKTL